MLRGLPFTPRTDWTRSQAKSAAIHKIRPLLRDHPRANRCRVLIVTPQPFYEDRGTPIAVQYVARALSDLDVDVDLLAFPIGESVLVKRMRHYRCENHLRLGRVPVGLSWRKLVLDVSLWHSFRQLIARSRYDMVHAVEEAAYMASVLCPQFDQPYIYDMASCIPDALQRKALLNFSPLMRLFRASEQRVISGASHTVCSAGLASYARERAPAASVSEWRFPAHAGAVPQADVAALRESLGIQSGEAVLLYTGNFAAYQGIDLMIEAFTCARLTNPHMILVCVGATDQELTKRRQTAVNGDHAHIRFLPRQPRERILTYTAMADALLLPRIGPENIPLKLYDYMASGKPIVAMRQSGSEGMLTDQRAILCDPTAESMARAIVRICEHPGEAALVGGEALRYAQKFFGWGEFVEFTRGIYETAIGDHFKFDEPIRQPLAAIASGSVS